VTDVPWCWRKSNAKEEFGRQNVLKERLSVIRPRFTIRLKRLQPMAPDFGSPKIWGVRTISSISVINYVCIFILVQRTLFYFAAYKRPLDVRRSTKDWSEWRWAFSFYGVEDWLLLRIIVDQNAWIRFSDYTRPVRYSINMQWVCGQITSRLPFSLVSMWLCLFLITRELRIK